MLLVFCLFYGVQVVGFVGPAHVDDDKNNHGQQQWPPWHGDSKWLLGFQTLDPKMLPGLSCSPSFPNLPDQN